MTMFKSVTLAILTVITLSVLAYVFDSTFNDLAVVFLIAQCAALTIHIGLITDKLNEKEDE